MANLSVRSSGPPLGSGAGRDAARRRRPSDVASACEGANLAVFDGAELAPAAAAHPREARAVAGLRTAAQGPGARMPRDGIARLVHSVSDQATVVRRAEAADKSEIHCRLGPALIHDPGNRKCWSRWFSTSTL